MYIMKGFSVFKQIDLSDILILLGCIHAGYGLFLLKNLGVSLVFFGVLLLNIGVLRSILGKMPKKG